MLSGLLAFRIEGPLGTGGMAWDPLRKHPRFQKFLEKHGARP
jgi:hypothetical protein